MEIARLIDSKEIGHQRHKSIYQLAWSSLKKRPAAIFGMVVIILYAIVALFTPLIAPFPITEIHLGFSDLPPAWVKDSRIHLSGDPRFLLGTDTLGRDVLSWALYGTRTSVFLGFLSAPVIALIGTLFGLVSGYLGGRVDRTLMRIADIFYAFPTIMVYIMVVLVLNTTPIGSMLNGILMMFIAILSVGWVSIARLVRSNVLTLKNTEFVEAAKAIGANPPRIIFKHIFPNVLSTIIVWVTYMIPQIILIECILGYLGIGINGADRYAFFAASYGGMFSEGRRAMYYQPLMTVLPAFGIVFISLAFVFLGDALRDAFDPRNQFGEKPSVQKGL
jgi:ABC-type dipeptide/oligopeptide/nickel transport system permease subunit